jgi:hypothetical protein
LRHKIKIRQFNNILCIFKSKKKSLFGIKLNNLFAKNSQNVSNNIFNLLAKFVHYISSHKISQYSNSIYPSYSNNNNSKYIQETEILNRLVSLKNIISVDILKHLGVNLITFDIFDTYSHVEKFEYYRSCIDKINLSIKNILEIIDVYMALEKEIKYCNDIVKNLFL